MYEGPSGKSMTDAVSNQFMSSREFSRINF